MATLTKGLKLSELTSLSASEKQHRVSEFCSAAIRPTPEQSQEQADELALQIQQFEAKHGMTSSHMLGLLESGQIQENSDICAWTMLLKIKSFADAV